MSGTSSQATLASHDPVLADFADEVGADGAVAVRGGGTRWSLGGPLDDGVRVLSAPSGIVEYVPEEMIVRVRAGTTVAELDAELSARGQRTALPRRSDSSTVGGALAVGENDVAMLGRGSVRSALLQVRYVSAEGRIITGGGPTVKNVTGFDLPRLMVGSLGTLGLLAEVIIRTNPIPAASQWLRSDDADPFRARDALLAPSAVLWDGSTTWIQLEGHGLDVEAEARALRAVGSFEAIDGPPALPTNRWSLAPAALRSLGSPDGPNGTGAFVAAVGTGLVFAERPQPARPIDPVITQVSNRMKLEFDPTGRLNPGRTPGRTE
ncbi:MAG: FAD-binding protein [Acidimicrobiales bacterium]